MEEQRQWSGKTDGTLWMHKALLALMKVLPLPVLYLIMGLVIPFYLLFNPKGRQAIWHYLRKRQGWGRVRSALGCYGNHFLFGTALLDRFAAYAGRKFKTDVLDYHYFGDLAAAPGAFVMLSSHIGNAEMCGYMLSTHLKRMNVISFPGEKSTIRSWREKMMGVNNIRMIPAEPDLGWLFTLNGALSDGEIVSIHADRNFGSPKSISVNLLSAKADIPKGPFAIAAMRGLPVIAAFTMKAGLGRYQVMLFRVDTPDMEGLPQEEKMQALADVYAATVEIVLHLYPLQWYNFFEFWKY